MIIHFTLNKIISFMNTITYVDISNCFFPFMLIYQQTEKYRNRYRFSHDKC